MRRIPPHVATLIRDLRATLWYRKRTEPGAVDRAIAAVGDAAHPAVIPVLLDLLERPGHVTAAAAALDRIVSAIPPTALPEAAEHARSDDWEESWGPRPLEWLRRTLTVASVPWIGLRFGAVAALTLHPNGYIREAALRRIADIHDGRELPFLLVRLNDWVEPIRVLATESVDARLNPANARAWLSCAALLPLVARGRRSPMVADRVARAQDLLRDVGVRQHLRKALAGAEAVTDRRALFDLALSVPDAGLAGFIAAALRDRDPLVRHRGSRLARSLPEPGRADAIRVMSADRYAPVRREAIYARLAADAAGAAPLLRRFLFDPHPSIRHAARVYLRDLEPTDARTEYLACISVLGPDLLGAVRGLGEVGRSDDIDVLVGVLNDGSVRPAVRAAAIQAIEHLSEDRATDLLVPALCSNLPPVSAAAKRILLRRGRRFPGSQLAPALGPDSPIHVRRNTARVLGAVDWPAAAAHLIRLAADPSLVAAARASLKRLQRLRQGAACYAPTDFMIQARREAADAIAEVGAHLDPDTLSLARFLAQ